MSILRNEHYISATSAEDNIAPSVVNKVFCVARMKHVSLSVLKAQCAVEMKGDNFCLGQ